MQLDPHTDISSIAGIVANLRSTYNSRITRPLDWRRQQLQAMINMLEENEEEFLEALKIDLGKPTAEAFITEKQAQKNDPGANSGYYITTARTYLKESGNEDAMRARIQAIEDEIYTINQPQTFSYSLERTTDPQGALNQ